MRSANIIRVMAGMLVTLATVVMADEPRTSGLPTSFTVEQPGRVSVAVYDSQGRLLRELLHAVPMAAGKQSMIWDGLDRDGKTVWKLDTQDVPSAESP
ncbi:MAG: hypothetical protein NTY19_25205 [Planctomycetota bacterium]|nr:hypothetical protein [Planctomycetota bacterium]